MRHINRDSAGQRNGAGSKDVSFHRQQHPTYVGVIDDRAATLMRGAPLFTVHRVGQSVLIRAFCHTNALPADTKCVALHTRLPSYDIQVGRTMYRESEFYWVASDDFNDATSMNHVLAGQYGQGTRVFAALECQYPEFAAPLYLGSVRLTMP